MNKSDYIFIRYPRALISSPAFTQISIEARTLLALILDRHELSEINSERFTDENGKIYVIYTIEEVCETFGCSKTRVIRLFNELINSNLIKRTRKDRLSPYRIYIGSTVYDLLNCNLAKAQNDTSREHKTIPRESTKRSPINNKYNNNNISNNKSSTYVTEDEIKERIEYECLYCEECAGMLDELVMIICDVLNGTSPTVRIGRDDMPREVVVNRFLMLDGEHIMSILWQLSRNKTKIRNMKAYLIMKLYNEVETGECEAAAALARYEK